MRLFELNMALDEGPRQDRAIELFNQLLPLRQSEGDKAFRARFIETMMQEFGMAITVAANAYNYAKGKANLPDLGRTAQRAARGLPPVVRPPRGRNNAVEPTEIPGEEPIGAEPEATKSDPQELMRDSEKYDGLKKGEIEWERYVDEGNLELSWTLEYTMIPAVEAMAEHEADISSANRTLEKFAKKYKDRLGRLKLQTMEKAQRSDDLRGGAEPKGTQYLSGSVDFRL
jgi:hypothetical protein